MTYNNNVMNDEMMNAQSVITNNGYNLLNAWELCSIYWVCRGKEIDRIYPNHLSAQEFFYDLESGFMDMLKTWVKRNETYAMDILKEGMSEDDALKVYKDIVKPFYTHIVKGNVKVMLPEFPF